MDEQLKQAIVYYSVLELQIELIEGLQGTNIFRQAEKHLVNKLRDRCKARISELFKVSEFNNSQSEYFNKCVDMVEQFVNVIKSENIDIFIELLSSFKNGDIRVVDENKHYEIIYQLPKLNANT